MTLYLFDIDGTLVDTGGAGMAALVETTRALFGDPGPPLDLAGATDLGIVIGIHEHFNVEPTPERLDRYFQIYQERLRQNLIAGSFPGRVIDGVLPLLDELAQRPDATLGLLTGNIAAGALLKIRHFGLEMFFRFGAYGCDHFDRNKLGPIALERSLVHTGQVLATDRVWVIGDTPKDIACARAMGAKCLAVATGRFTSAELAAHGADHVVDSLDQALTLI